MQNKSIISLLLATVVVSALIAGTASAATSPAGNWAGRGARTMVRPVVSGTVGTVSGNTFTVTDTKNTVYTVDDTNAKITKGFGKTVQTLTAADIKSGDKLVVMGTVSGTAVAATAIIDGVGMMKPSKVGRAPGVFGTVAALNGGSFTIITHGRMGKSTTATSATKTFTVTTNSSTVVAKDNQTATLSDLAVGQTVMVQGTVDNTALTVVATKLNITTKMPTKPTIKSVVKNVVKNVASHFKRPMTPKKK